MSLIADSLKKAVKDKPKPSEPATDFNLIAKSALPPSNKAAIIRVFLLIGLPGGILAFLIYAGAFDKGRTSITNLPIFNQSAEKNSPAMAPQQTAALPLEIEPAPEPQPVEAEPPVQASAEKPEVQPPVAKVNPAPVSRTPQKSAPQARPEAAEPPSEKFLEETQEKLAMAIQSIEDAMRAEEGEPEEPLEIFTPPVKRKPAPKPVARKPKNPAPGELGGGVFIKESPPEREPEPKFIPREIAVPRLPPPIPREPVVPQPTLAAHAPPSDIFQDGNYFFNRGVFFQESGKREKALINFRKAAELDPNNPDIYNNMGVIYKDLGMYDQATEDLLRALYLDPKYAKAYNNLGVVALLQKNYSGSISNFQRALKFKPDNLETYNNMAAAYKKLGQRDKAKSVLEKAVSLDSNHSVTNYNLGLWYEEAGGTRNAKHFYRRFVAFGSAAHPDLVTQVKNHLQSMY